MSDARREHGRWPRWRWRARAVGRIGTLLAAMPAIGTAVAQAQDWPQLKTDQNYIEEVRRPTSLAVDDPMAVFSFVFNSLPERVKIYPTENYFYFTFVHRGVPYNGNIRLDASDRDQGKLHFGYSEDMAEWRRETPLTYRLLDASRGVTVEKLERFLYRVTHAGRSVLFELNDLSQAKPPADVLAPEETFVGPIADESGLRFFLVFNERLRIFLYTLDETTDVPDGFEPSPHTDRIIIGKRTGYAFYRDQRRPRKILIGEFFTNSRVNNYFDGPFDQLPDNFIEGDAFRTMLLKAEPSAIPAATATAKTIPRILFSIIGPAHSDPLDRLRSERLVLSKLHRLRPIRTVIAGLDPAIHPAEMAVLSKMDTRIKPAHDESLIAAAGSLHEAAASSISCLATALVRPDANCIGRVE
jgi:hypothetical protein